MNGVLIVNKAEGITSQEVVSKIKKLLNEKKVGHTGTLDPLATGVLPILLGNSTKLSKYLIKHDKTYRAIVKLGKKTSTGDREGDIVETKNVPKDLDIFFIDNKIKSFVGRQVQKPPIYSAIKVNGKKLYQYARENKSVDIPSRQIEIYEIRLINFDIKNEKIEFEVRCSKGTYIRTLCEDIADSLGTVGYMDYLCRTEVNEFKLENSYTLEDVENGKYSIISMQELFSKFSKINLDSRKLELFLNGVKLKFYLDNGIYNIYSLDRYIGTGIIENNLLKRDVIEI